MKLLSEHEANLLQGKLHRIPLPVRSHLYVSEGIPQVFHRVTGQPPQAFEDSWLYVPITVLDSMRQRLLVEAVRPDQAIVSTEPHETEDGNLYPLLTCGQVRAIIVDTDGSRPPYGRQTVESISEALQVSDAEKDVDTIDLAAQFVGGVLSAELTLSDFFQRALSVLAGKCPRSLAGVYARTDHGYRQRLVMGDISYFDYLPRELSHELSKLWDDAARRGRYFVPAQPVPDLPCFLCEPPHFVFVHRGIRADHTDFLTAVALSGEAGRRSVMSLIYTAGLMAGIHERQLNPAIDFERLASRIEGVALSKVTIDEVLTDLFARLQTHLRLSRLTVDPVNGPSRVLVSGAGGQVRLELRDRNRLSQELLVRMRTRHRLLIEDTAAADFEPDLTAEYHDDTVRSEICFPVFLRPRRQGIVTFGAADTGPYLRDHSRLLLQLAHFISLCSALGDGAAGSTGIDDARTGIGVDQKKSARFATISKLSDGYFHDIVDLLSVVLGQTSMVENSVSSMHPSPEADVALSSARKINGAVDTITQHLRQLRRLSTLTPEQYARPMSVSDLLRDLGSLLGGFARQILDSKNIVLDIVHRTEPRTDLQLRGDTVFDTLLPLVMSLMEEAICSGKLALKLRRTTGEPALDIVFDRAIIGHTTLEEFLARIHPAVAAAVDEHGVGTMTIGNVRLVFSTPMEHMCLITIQLATATAEEPAAPQVVGEAAAVVGRTGER